MVRIVVIHGRNRVFRIEGEVLTLWREAIAQGLRTAKHAGHDPADLSLVFYGDLWRPDADEDIDGRLRLEREAIAQQLGAIEIADLIDRLPWPMFLDWLASLAPGGVARAILRLAFEDLHDYLTDDARAADVMDRVAERMPKGEEPIILVGYSMGSLIGYEYLRRVRDERIRAFVTVGSPLGLARIRGMLADALKRRAPDIGEPLAFPPTLRLWYNVHSPRDPATGGGEISEHFLSGDRRSVMDRIALGDPDDPHSDQVYASSVTFGVCLRALLEHIEPGEGVEVVGA